MTERQTIRAAFAFIFGLLGMILIVGIAMGFAAARIMGV